MSVLFISILNLKNIISRFFKFVIEKIYIVFFLLIIKFERIITNHTIFDLTKTQKELFDYEG